MVPNASVWRRLSLAGASFALLSTMLVSTAAQAVGDTVLNQYLIADPLPSGTALPDSMLLTLVASEEAQLDADIAGNGYVRLALSAWVDASTGDEVVSQLAVFTGATTIPSAVASVTALAACPPAAATTPTTVPVALISGSAEATCVSVKTNLTEYVIAWSTNNVLAIVVVSGQTQSQAESIAVSQAALVPTTVINLASSASYVVSHFAQLFGLECGDEAADQSGRDRDQQSQSHVDQVHRAPECQRRFPGQPSAACRPSTGTSWPN